MEFLKNWASLISGTIIFAALCELLIPKGSAKKYVKLILGMILTLALMSPFESIFGNREYYKFFDFEKFAAYETESGFSDLEFDYVMSLYKENLAQSIKKSIEKEISAKIFVVLDISKEEKNFGEIEKVYIKAVQQGGFKDFKDEIFEILKRDYGVENKKINLKFTTYSGGDEK